MGDFYRSVWSLPMCNFIMYHTEIGICHKLKQIATKTLNVRAHCVAEPDANQRRKCLRRPDLDKAKKRKNAWWELGFRDVSMQIL